VTGVPEAGADVEAELRAALGSLAGVFDEEEPVDELAHAQQCATLALAAGAGPELVAAALFHDVGRAVVVGAAHPGLAHELAGARWLASRTAAKVAWLVGAHVPAKVYLVEHDPDYAGALTPASMASLARQRGHHPPLAELAAHAWWAEALQLRRWDDAGKVPGAPVADLGSIFDTVRPVLAS